MLLTVTLLVSTRPIAARPGYDDIDAELRLETRFFFVLFIVPSFLTNEAWLREMLSMKIVKFNHRRSRLLYGSSNLVKYV